MKILLVSGKRGYKITEPLATTNLPVQHINIHGVSTIKKLKTLLTIANSLVGRDSAVYEYVVISDHPNLFSLVLVSLAQLKAIPFVLRLRGDIWQEISQEKNAISSWLRRMVTNFIVRNSQVVLPVSDSLRNVVVKQSKIVPSKVITIPISVTLRDIDAPVTALPEQVQETLCKTFGCQILLTITNFKFEGKARGLLKMIPLFQRLLQKYDIHWLIVGGGQYLTDFQREIYQAHGLQGRVHILGYVHPVWPLLRKADLVIYFSEEDGFPNVTLEAQAVGKTVVVNNYPPLMEQVKHGVTGFVVNPEDMEVSANVIGELLSNTKIRDDVGQNARRLVVNEYSDATIGARFHHVFTNIHSAP